MAHIVLGPLLRYVGTSRATVWVETDGPCEVEVLGHRRRTFHVEGHHYALVVVEGLPPDGDTPYEVHLDGERVWPRDDGRPASRIVTRSGEDQARLVFGSCRAGDPHEDPFTRDPREHPDGLGVDALWAYSRRLQTGEEPWPDCLILLGDQVYADEVSPETAEYIRGRAEEAGTRGGRTAPPPNEVADFEEYTRLYRESWCDPDIRWLLATVPSTMVFDDHDVHDDWNISDRWVRGMRALPWWEERIVGAHMSYWIYQHIGNLAPTELHEEPLLEQVYEDEDAGPRLRAAARRADREPAHARFAFHRDYGRTRLVVLDTRAARVLTPGERAIVDPDEWRWVVERSRVDVDHLILASTVPVFLAHGIHHGEAWNERLCAGAWGRPVARVSERLRQALDFDHWPAFMRSFRRMVALLHERSTSADPAAPAPATIMLLGGDVHTAYVAEVDLGPGQRSRVYQLVCSPFRKPLSPRERRTMRLLFSEPVAWVGRVLSRAAGVRPVPVRWRLVSGPTFPNSIGVIDIDGRAARVEIRQSDRTDDGGSTLLPLQRRDLTGTSPRERRNRGRLRGRRRSRGG
jgi:hypothetical protein